MVQVAKLSADLYAKTTRFESGMKKASTVLGRFSSSLDSNLTKNGRSFDRLNSRITNTNRTIGFLKSELISFAGIAASAFSVSKVVKYSDTYKELSGRLAVATDGVGDLVKIQNDLFNISQKNAAPLKDVIDAYSRLSLSLNDVQKKENDLTQITDLLSKTLLVSGTNAAGAATFFQQFGQAASSDFKAVGQEIQTFADQNAFFIKILQENLDTGGKSIKQFAADGQLSFDLIAKALVSGSERINEAVEGIPNTVGKAMQRLDNAFLRLIGQSNLANNGVSSLAFGITALADNLGNLSLAVGGLAVVVASRLLTSLTATATAFAANALQATAYQAALARMAGVSRVAAVAQTTLAGALGLVSRGLALIGGPIGVAAIASYYLWAKSTNAAKDSQVKLNESMTAFRSKADSYILASGDMRKAITEDTKARIQAYIQELKTLDRIQKTLEGENFLFRKSRELGSALGIDSSAKDVENLKNNVQSAITELEASLDNFGKIDRGEIKPSGTGGTTGDTTEFDKVLDGLKRESDEVRIQLDLYGQKSEIIDAALKRAEIEAELKAKGIELTAEQTKQIDEQIEQIRRQNEELSEQKELTEELDDTYEDLGDSFEDAFDAAVSEGKKLSDVLKDLAKDIAKIVLKKALINPRANAIGGAFGGTVEGSFATGIKDVPRDMTARLHKGETVLTAQQSNKMRNSIGGGGGAVYNIDARGASAGVEQKIANAIKQVEQLRKEVPSIAVSSVKDADSRGRGI